MQIGNAQGDVMRGQLWTIGCCSLTRTDWVWQDRGAAQVVCHIPRESGEGRLIILNFKRRSMVTVEVKDLGEANEGVEIETGCWKVDLKGANLTSIRVPGTNHNGRIIKETGG